METYKKPTIVGEAAIGGLIPLIAGLSAAKLAVIGVAAGLGLGAAMKGKIDSSHTKILAARRVLVEE